MDNTKRLKHHKFKELTQAERHYYLNQFVAFTRNQIDIDELNNNIVTSADELKEFMEASK